MSRKISIRIGSRGISAGFLLFLVFLVLKLCGVITWSWLWVTAPLWGGLALLLLIFTLIGLLATLVWFFSRR